MPTPGRSQPGSPATPPPDYLVAAIVATFLCLPLGLIAIVNATRVNKHWARGLTNEAWQCSRSAKNFALWGAMLGIALLACWGIGAIISAASNP
jgi:hypothetical protein